MIILAATPIGNLGDASKRLIEALTNAEIIASEDTRTTIHLMRALGIENRPRLIALHEHNETEKAAEIAELARATDVLVLSDAGMPAISDPGFPLVAAAAAAGVTVTPAAAAAATSGKPGSLIAGIPASESTSTSTVRASSTISAAFSLSLCSWIAMRRGRFSMPSARMR